MEKGIFEGLKVLDCASFIAAPAAATVLSDFGAEVIKIEPPGTGDPYRNLPNLPGYPRSAHNFAWLLEARNKRSLALDLSKPEGQAVLHRLAAEADVFITNFPPAVRARLGSPMKTRAAQRAADLCVLHRLWRKGRGSQQARLRQQRLLGALGPDGSGARRCQYDAGALGRRHGRPPLRDGAVRRDRHRALQARTHRQGLACRLEPDGQRRLGHGVLAQAKLCGAKFGERRPRERALNAVTNHYKCQDGRWLILSLLNEERQWPALARCLGREDLIADARFATKADRHARSLELIRIFDEIFATRDLAEWRKILDGNGLVFGVVGILDDIPNDRQMIDNDVLVPFENDTMLTVNSPIWVDGSQKVQPRQPPDVGEHSDEILREAGYDEAAIRQLRASGAVA